MNIGTIRKIGSDIAGGSMAGLLALPETLAYGILVFSPLGPEGLLTGVVAGLCAVVFINIVPVFFPGSRILSSGPFSLSSIMLASVTAYALKQTSICPVSPVIIVFFTVFLAGLFQLLFGVFKIGTLAKFIPQPVVSGLLNGTSLLIFITQIRPALGLDKSIDLFDPVQMTSNIKIFTLVIVAATCLSIFVSEKLTKKIPGPVVGIICGSLVYYGLLISGIELLLPQSAVRTIPFKIQVPDIAAGFYLLLRDPDALRILTDLVPMAMGISIIISMRTLIAVVSVDNVTRTRTNSNLELIGQGAGHIAAAFFGGIASAGSISRSLASHKYGATGILSRIATGLFALLVLTVLYPAVSLIPGMVLTGLLITLAFSSFDKWSIEQARYIFNRKAYNRKIAVVNVMIIAAVTITMIAAGTFEAVGLGVVISIIYFIITMTRSIVRDSYDASLVRSNFQRVSRDIMLLEDAGHRIYIMELEGPLFFGTADNLADNLYKIFDENFIDFIILDFKRVQTIDSTGLHILSQLKNKAGTFKKKILLSNLDYKLLSYAHRDFSDCVFVSFNDALSYAEDMLLSMIGTSEAEEYTLDKFETLSHLEKEELQLASKYFSFITIKSGLPIFSQNDKSSEMYLLCRGRVNIEIAAHNENQRTRISTVCPGTIFGEMALIDGKMRSAFAIADSNSDIACYTLSTENLDALCAEFPETGFKIIAGITSEISRRVRIANNMLSCLKS